MCNGLNPRLVSGFALDAATRYALTYVLTHALAYAGYIIPSHCPYTAILFSIGSFLCLVVRPDNIANAAPYSMYRNLIYTNFLKQNVIKLNVV